ncbi:hypothetical protein PSTG_02850 [Puccinia striiformis f. sp. tritici PST-78]|uniref:Uncharacterized protein n=1 Tax=Puccinia striiformis f. sp. tritici PST-78 TaxID=1165861 RepID=A0A0L0VWV4_9BASI|nr:hypothetical protein PSTG_02850 [Puccinia striiformis f. sp. tritici PST-78]
MSYCNQPTPLDLYVFMGFYNKNSLESTDGYILPPLDCVEETSLPTNFSQKKEPAATHLLERELTMRKYTGSGNLGVKIRPMDKELIFDGVAVPVDKFIRRYESAGKSDRAAARDLAEQILPFVKGDLKAKVEAMSGYINADWEVLKIQVLDRFGQGPPLVKPGTLNITRGTQAQKEVPAPGAHSLLGRLEESQTAKLMTGKIGNTERLRSGNQVAGTVSVKRPQETKELLSVKDLLHLNCVGFFRQSILNLNLLKDDGRACLAAISTPTDQKCEATFPSNMICASNVVTVAKKASDSRFLEKPRQKEELGLVHTTDYKSNADEIEQEIVQEGKVIKSGTNKRPSTVTAFASAELGVKLTQRKGTNLADPPFAEDSLMNMKNNLGTEQVALGLSLNMDSRTLDEEHWKPLCPVSMNISHWHTLKTSLAHPAPLAKSEPETILRGRPNTTRTGSEDAIEVKQAALGPTIEADEGEQVPRCPRFIDKGHRHASKTSFACPEALENAKPAANLKESQNVPKSSRMSFFSAETPFLATSSLCFFLSASAASPICFFPISSSAKGMPRVPVQLLFSPIENGTRGRQICVPRHYQAAFSTTLEPTGPPSRRPIGERALGLL